MNSNKNKHSKDSECVHLKTTTAHTTRNKCETRHHTHNTGFYFCFYVCLVFIYYCSWTRTCMEPAWSLFRACLEPAWISLGAYDESAWSLLGVHLESTWIWRLLEFSLEDTWSLTGANREILFYFSRRHLELGITTTMITSQATTRDQLEILPRIAS